MTSKWEPIQAERTASSMHAAGKIKLELINRNVKQTPDLIQKVPNLIQEINSNWIKDLISEWCYQVTGGKRQGNSARQRYRRIFPRKHPAITVIKAQKEQTGLHQLEKLLYISGIHPQSEKTVNWWAKNICKLWNWQKINIQVA